MMIENRSGTDVSDFPAVRVNPEACPSRYRLVHKLGRLVWANVWFLLARPTPRCFDGWRRFLLRCFGARIGRGARILGSARIWAPWNLEMGDYACISDYVDCYCVDRIRIGAHATVSQYAFLCTASHDIGDPHMRLVTAPIVIDEQAWVCAGVFVGKGVVVGRGAVAAARAVVVRNVEPWTVVGGNPARFIKKRELTGARS